MPFLQIFLEISNSLNLTDPKFGISKPSIISTSVDFPEPLEPMIPILVFRSIERERLFIVFSEEFE